MERELSGFAACLLWPIEQGLTRQAEPWAAVDRRAARHAEDPSRRWFEVVSA